MLALSAVFILFIDVCLCVCICVICCLFVCFPFQFLYLVRVMFMWTSVLCVCKVYRCLSGKNAENCVSYLVQMPIAEFYAE